MSQAFPCSQTKSHLFFLWEYHTVLLYHSNFGSQLIMLCMQATLMTLHPELWIYMLWPPLLLRHIYYNASTAVDNCCIHLLWLYAASTWRGYTATTAVVGPKLPLWNFVHCINNDPEPVDAANVCSTLGSKSTEVLFSRDPP